MIMIKNGMLAINGSEADIMVETVLILHSVYQKMVANHGEKEANEALATMGRLAVSSDEEIGVDSIEL